MISHSPLLALFNALIFRSHTVSHIMPVYKFEFWHIIAGMMKRFALVLVLFISVLLHLPARCETDVAAWGSNEFGYLGDGSNIFSSNVPVLVDRSGVLNGKTITAIASGATQLALCSDGTLASWGLNNEGQLGNGSTATMSNVPVLVDRSGVLSGKTVTAIASGAMLLALCSDGTLASWGYNYFGGLGNGSSVSFSNVPVLVDRSGVLRGKTITAIAANGEHSLALCSDGTLVAWGLNSYGQLGNGSTAFQSNVPVLVDRSGVLRGKTITAIAAGGFHSLALCSDGTLAVWGMNSQGQLGSGGAASSSSNVPVLVDRSGVLRGKTVTAIAAGVRHSLALCSDGTLASWGLNNEGQLGNGSTATMSNVPVLVDRSGVLSGKTVTAIASGAAHNLALCSDGTLADWGANGYGQLGNGLYGFSNVPVLVDRSGVLRGKTITAIEAGSTHSHALINDGPPSLIANNVSRAMPEGSATTPGSATFNITLSAAATQTVTVNYCTADGLAKAGSDYVAKSGTLTFAPGQTIKRVTVPFIGDSTAEVNETFFLDLRTPVNATIVDSRGNCYIGNDDGPGIIIDNARAVVEGQNGFTSQVFTVRLSAASTNTISVEWATANGTAGPADYTVASGRLTFAPGEISKTITVQVKGDTTVEPNEMYKVNLTRPFYAVIADSQGNGYIINDDVASVGATSTPSQ